VPVRIVNNHHARTFYVWDPAISSDPFAFAIFYTVLGIPIARLAERKNRPMIGGRISRATMVGTFSFSVPAGLSRISLT